MNSLSSSLEFVYVCLASVNNECYLKRHVGDPALLNMLWLMSFSKHALPIMNYAGPASNQNTPFVNVVEKPLMVYLNKINI